MKRFLMMVLLLAFSALGAAAQEKILVTGTVTPSIEGVSMGGTRIYAFNTVSIGVHERELANAAYEDSGVYVPEYPFVDTYAMSDGYYEIQVPANGYLIFEKFPYKPVCVKVSRRTEINVEIETTNELDEATLIEEGKKKTKKGKPVARGNRFGIENEAYYFDESALGIIEGIGKENARLVSQMYVVNSDGSDTLMFFQPKVYDGEQFHKTQYHWHHDELYEIADKSPRLPVQLDSIQHTAHFELEDPTALYFLKANIWIEDYLNVYYRDTVTLFNTGRVRRPEQFLDYSFTQCELDPQKYFKEPRRENVSDAKNLKLQFKIGKAELDESDEETMRSLEELKAEIRDICTDPSATLTGLKFEGYASPDGPYAKNAELSDKRTKVVQQAVESFRSNELLRADRFAKGYVAPWTDVADLLERDSLKAEAAEVRARVQQNEGSMDKQGAAIKKLKYYNQLIVPRLPELRSVKCTHTAIVKRILKPEEIFRKYQEDSLFRMGKKYMTLNEYWHLFDLVKDEKELESLYLRGLGASRKMEGKFWPLPANNLAVMKLKRKQVDTLLLAPFIDERYRANQPWTDKDGNKDYDRNPDAIVANQVQMFMLAKKYARAEELSSIIEEEHPMLRAVVRCLGGYIDYEDPKEKATIDLIKSSSPRNEAVINMQYLALFDSTTVQALQRMPQDHPVTDYMKAQFLCMKYEDDVMKMKATDFDRTADPSFSHPKDEIIPAATPEEIQALKETINILVSDIQLYKEMGLDVADMEKELEGHNMTLATMEKGETTMIPAQCSVYDAACIYLKRCFERDKKYVRTAQADLDITEELLNDVLGIKKDKK